MFERLRALAGGRDRTNRSPRKSFIEIEHDGVVHRIALKRVGTARRFTLRVRTARRDVVLTMPSHGSVAAARVFAVRHAAWVAERLSALAPPIAFAPGSDIPFRGRTHRIVHRPGLRRTAWTEEMPDGPILCVSGPDARIAATLAAFLRSEARIHLAVAVARNAAAANVTVGNLALRDTRSRWGSCTARGALSFSWRLILAPPLVLDYLAAHEVAHRVHLDHSRAFWTLVRSLFPAVDEAEDWLRRNGSTLHRYGATSGAAAEVNRAAD